MPMGRAHPREAEAEAEEEDKVDTDEICTIGKDGGRMLVDGGACVCATEAGAENDAGIDELCIGSC